MTEVEWLNAIEPTEMLYLLWKTCSERKLRLYECACCRRVWDQLTDERSISAVIVAEQFADGLATEKELEDASTAADAVIATNFEFSEMAPRLPLEAAAYNIAIPMEWWGGAPAFLPPSTIVRDNATDPQAEALAQTILLRDIFPNPCRPIAGDARWLVSSVLDLAEGIYTRRAFERLPILADALEDAGCDNTNVLNHCRSDGPHVRGCWVIDLLTNRK